MTANVHTVWRWWCEECPEASEEEFISEAAAERDAAEHDRLSGHTDRANGGEDRG